MKPAGRREDARIRGNCVCFSPTRTSGKSGWCKHRVETRVRRAIVNESAWRNSNRMKPRRVAPVTSIINMRRQTVIDSSPRPPHFFVLLLFFFFVFYFFAPLLITPPPFSFIPSVRFYAFHFLFPSVHASLRLLLDAAIS